MIGSAFGSMLSNRCNQGDYRRAGSRRPLARHLNGEGIGACVAGVCCVLECGSVELSQALRMPVFAQCSKLAMTPSILSGKRQAPPDATLKTPVELMPKVDSIPATGHSEAVCADETDTKPGAARTIAKAIAFDTRMKVPAISIFKRLEDSRFPGAPLIWIKEASGHVWTAPGWQGLSSRFAALVGAAMCPAF